MSFYQLVSNWIDPAYRVRGTKLSDNSILQHLVQTDITGVPIKPSVRGRKWTGLTSTVTETAIVLAGSAGIFRDLYLLTISNRSSSDVTVTIRDVTASATFAYPYRVTAGSVGGFALPIDSAVPQATAASAWTAQCSGSVDSIDIWTGYVERSS